MERVRADPLSRSRKLARAQRPLVFSQPSGSGLHTRPGRSFSAGLDGRASGKTSKVEELETAQLLGLLQIYEIALGELQRLGDKRLAGLIARYKQRQAEVVSALAARNSAAIAAVREFGSAI